MVALQCCVSATQTVNQLYVYLYLLPREALSRAPSALQVVPEPSSFPLGIYISHTVVHMSALPSQVAPAPPPVPGLQVPSFTPASLFLPCK